MRHIQLQVEYASQAFDRANYYGCFVICVDDGRRANMRPSALLKKLSLVVAMTLVLASIQGCGMTQSGLSEGLVIDECNRHLDELIPSELTEVFPDSRADARMNQYSSFSNDSECIATVDVYWSVGDVDDVDWEDVWSRLMDSLDTLSSVSAAAARATEESLASQGYDASIYTYNGPFLIDDEDYVYYILDNSVFRWPFGDENDYVILVDHIDHTPKPSAPTSTCPTCGGSGMVKYWDVDSDLEAELLGPDAYHYSTCPTCNGTGRA